jgi:SAM-dependent methyltransferase
MQLKFLSTWPFALLGTCLTWMLFLCGPAAWAQDVASFQALLSGPQRSEANVVRDPFRHPAETLAFFGIQSNHTVVEILPGSGGYYMEILAPWLRDKGRYIAANRDQSLPQYIPDHQKLLERLKAEPQHYDQVVVTAFRADNHPIAPAGSADAVISFRNLHNWMERQEVVESLRAFHKALKPGGVLGIVDHRGRNDQSQAQQMAAGYVREDVAIALIEANGFRLTGRTEINANPKDTKDYPEGVWSLAPTYRMKDVDRAKLQAIGESDRFTLRFVKR